MNVQRPASSVVLSATVMFGFASVCGASTLTYTLNDPVPSAPILISTPSFDSGLGKLTDIIFGASATVTFTCQAVDPSPSGDAANPPPVFYVQDTPWIALGPAITNDFPGRYFSTFSPSTQTYYLTLAPAYHGPTVYGQIGPVTVSTPSYDMAANGVFQSNFAGATFNLAYYGAANGTEGGPVVSSSDGYFGTLFTDNCGRPTNDAEFNIPQPCTVSISYSFTPATNTGGSSMPFNVSGGTTLSPTAGGGIQPFSPLSVNLSNSSTFTLATGASHSDRTLLVTSGLTLAGSTGNWTGTIDFGGNDGIIRSANASAAAVTLATITNQIQSGYANGAWTGTGITSSAAAADTSHLTALGVIQNNQGGTPVYSATNLFDGQAPQPTDVLIKYTYYGDANLDGKVDGSDYSRIDNGYLNHLTGWFNGDFNYDGVVDGSDYSLIDNAFNTQGAALAGEVANSTAEIAAPSTNSVPEPAGLSLLAIGSLALLGRPRRARIVHSMIGLNGDD